MTDPSVLGEKMLARNVSLRRLAIGGFLAVANAIGIWAIISGNQWSSHVNDGTHTEVPASPAAKQ